MARALRLRDRVILERGRTAPLEALPEWSIALDGYVQGPQFDVARRRFSFDHHAGCIRHSTLSSCEQALDAIRVGLEPTPFTIYINDLDPDTVLATWVLLRPAAARHRSAVLAIRSLGRVDALGPAVGGPGLVPALAWALAPILDPDDPPFRTRSADAWWNALEDCISRLDGWLAAGAPSRDRAMTPPRRERKPVRIQSTQNGWVLAEGMGVRVYAALYEAGHTAAIVYRLLPNGTTEYTVGKASEFVSGFDVPAILEGLRGAELARNPAQDPARNWGGGSTIGGSPRNADGTASRLSPAEVRAVVLKVQAR